VPVDLLMGHDALINCAGHVADRDTFVRLVDRLVASVEALLCLVVVSGNATLCPL
jgi:hypothetical protein